MCYPLDDVYEPSPNDRASSPSLQPEREQPAGQVGTSVAPTATAPASESTAHTITSAAMASYIITPVENGNVNSGADNTTDMIVHSLSSPLDTFSLGPFGAIARDRPLTRTAYTSLVQHIRKVHASLSLRERLCRVLRSIVRCLRRFEHEAVQGALYGFGLLEATYPMQQLTTALQEYEEVILRRLKSKSPVRSRITLTEDDLEKLQGQYQSAIKALRGLQLRQWSQHGLVQQILASTQDSVMALQAMTLKLSSLTDDCRYEIQELIGLLQVAEATFDSLFLASDQEFTTAPSTPTLGPAFSTRSRDPERASSRCFRFADPPNDNRASSSRLPWLSRGQRASRAGNPTTGTNGSLRTVDEPSANVPDLLPLTGAADASSDEPPQPSLPPTQAQDAVEQSGITGPAATATTNTSPATQEAHQNHEYEIAWHYVPLVPMSMVHLINAPVGAWGSLVGTPYSSPAVFAPVTTINTTQDAAGPVLPPSDQQSTISSAPLTTSIPAMAPVSHVEHGL
ncbi:hypothetical protein BGZ73_000804 [Actinomortierella ambigua]|nr:hypothetical protein BGZ73_000804 [Actinomortierella ambigua]